MQRPNLTQPQLAWRLGLALVWMVSCAEDPVKDPGIDLDGDGFLAEADCDDQDAAVHPDADEACDGVDNNCDGYVDDPTSVDRGTFYRDVDGDGFGTTSSVTACAAPSGYAAADGDCDDQDATSYPDAPEDDCADPVDHNCDGSVGYADADGDGDAACVDCDDDDDDRSSSTPERCNGLDDNCDGQTDEGAAEGAVPWYADADADGHGGDTDVVVACSAPVGYVGTDTDCDDLDPAIHPGAAESDCDDPTDYNCDGSVGLTDADADGYVACTDCDDAAGSTFPGAPELCDGDDDDCDGLVDDEVTDAPTWYADTDGDGYGADDRPLVVCEAPRGYSEVPGDCDDTDNDIHPGADELDCADPTDYNCDGTVGYADADGDGFPACEDCDDADGAAWPGADERCDGSDDDCDGSIDEDAVDAPLRYLDADGDQVGVDTTTVADCEVPVGYAALSGDCDDTRADVAPGQAERCDDIDNDCDGDRDEDPADGGSWYIDADGDGSGDPADVMRACEAVVGRVAAGDDCDDQDDTVYVGAEERCDGRDHDCDGLVLEDDAVDALPWYGDTDGDGFGDPADVAYACVAPPGRVADELDCDDTDATISPGSSERCGGGDEDCDGLTDEADAIDPLTWYADLDADGYGDPASTAAACTPPLDYVGDNTDCDDLDGGVSPGLRERCDGVDNDCDGASDEADSIDPATWYADADGDGQGDPADTTLACDAPPGRVASATDCDDTDATTFVGATERCDGDDDDCDGVVDEDAPDAPTWYLDVDADGHGAASDPLTVCDQPAGYAAADDDCDDTDPLLSPSEAELCDYLDNDCDGVTDEADALDAPTWYIDVDGDLFGDDSLASVSCEAPPGGVLDGGDCRDDKATVNPSVAELCNGADDDCDGVIDEPDAADSSTWFADNDADSWGDAADAEVACDAPAGRVSRSGDCDDGAADISPSATERCDSVDNDCDGATDENTATDAVTWYLDADADGYGLSGSTTRSCTSPAGYASVGGDCADGAAAQNPGVAETCNSVDDDCDGSVDESAAIDAVSWYRDDDLDGYGTDESEVVACIGPSGYVTDGGDCDDLDVHRSPGETEVCGTGSDDDCNDDESVCELPSSFTTSTADLGVDGAGTDDYLGAAVAAGDLNGDGDTDLILGAYGYDPSGLTAAGRIYVLNGPASGTLATSSAIITGSVSTGFAGRALMADGDLNGDGRDDLLIGAQGVDGAGSDSGAIYVVRSPSGSSTTASAAFILSGTSAGDLVGSAMSAGGDVDGDGMDDLWVGAYGRDLSVTTTNAGYGALFYGPLTGTTTLSGADMVLPGTTRDDDLGVSVRIVGDLDGDGLADLTIGAPGRENASVTNVGAVYVVFGPPATSVLDPSSTDAAVYGAVTQDGIGTGFAAGDLDDDGAADLLIAAATANVSASDDGAVYVFSGTTLGGTHAVTDATARLSGAARDDAFGTALVVPGDINGDTLRDVVVSAPGASRTGYTDCGAVYLFYGPFSGNLVATSADSVLSGAAAGAGLATALAGGDTNTDGFADLLIGTSRTDVGGNNTGSAYVVLGEGR